ncbi:MAG: site-specific integrase [bacterium]
MGVYKEGKAKDGRQLWRIQVYRKGERRQRKIRGTKKEARDIEAALRIELENEMNRKLEPELPPTFSSFCVDTYKPHGKAHLSFLCWRNRKYQLARLCEFFGQHRLDEISAQRVETFKETRLATGRKPAGINDDLKVFRVVLQYAVDLGHAIDIPRWKKLQVQGRSRVQFWSADEVKDLLDACKAEAPDIHDLVLFIANTGVRKGEAIALRACSIDMDRRVVSVEPYEGYSTKSNSAREVPISDAIYGLCKEAVESGREWLFLCPATKKRYAFFPGRKWDKVVAEAGLKGGPHRLRHTYASHLVMATGDLFLVSKVLGHSHSRVSEIYAHLMPNHLARARTAVSFSSGTCEAESRPGLSVVR